MRRYLTGVLALCVIGTQAQAALFIRAGGQAVYDSTSNVTWIANANLAAPNNFGVPGIISTGPGAGQMNWNTAQAWIAAMNTASYLGVNNWRLPATVQPDFSCNTLIAPGQYGGFNCALSEMARMFYLDGISASAPGLFNNLQPGIYWSGTEYATDATSAWIFYFSDGDQSLSPKSNCCLFAWPVTPGDPLGTDFDGDGIADSIDNCKLVPNADQRDTNGDGYGNICDPDFNGDGVVNINDLNRLKARLNIVPVVDVDTDLDGNGAVNINDLNRLKSFLGKPPGPSGLHPNCPPTCP
jgi:hypothetical protein